MDKRKTYLLIGLFVIAAIIAFAIYKGISSSKNTTITTGGTTTSSSSTGVLTPLLSFLSF